MQRKRLVFTTLFMFALLAALPGLLSAQNETPAGGTAPGIIIPSDATLIVRKVVVGAAPANDWQFTGTFSFSLPAGGGETTIHTTEGTKIVTETAVAGYTASVSCNSGETGTSSVTVSLSADETATCTFTNTQGGPSTANLYVSAMTAGNVGGVAATPQDILFRNGAANSWAMHFDGSDVGVVKALSAFARLPNGDILLVFKANQNTPAGTFTPWDVARFTPTSTGANTAGTFSWYFDGSDVGLTTSGEKIDALDVLPDGRVLISTGGALSVPNGGGSLGAQDEDLVALTPGTLGATTAGTWAVYFNGTAVPGMKAEDLAGAHVNGATGDVYAAITGTFNIGGVSGAGMDVIKITPAGSVSMYWRGANNGFNLNVGGLELP